MTAKIEQYIYITIIIYLFKFTITQTRSSDSSETLVENNYTVNEVSPPLLVDEITYFNRTFSNEQLTFLPVEENNVTNVGHFSDQSENADTFKGRNSVLNNHPNPIGGISDSDVKLNSSAILLSNDSFISEYPLADDESSDLYSEQNFHLTTGDFDGFADGKNVTSNETLALWQINNTDLILNDSSDTFRDASEAIIFKTVPESPVSNLEDGGVQIPSEHPPNNSTSTPRGMKETVFAGLSRLMSAPIAAVKRSGHSWRQGRQSNFSNKAGRRARLPGESHNTVRLQDKPPTLSRSSLIPSIPFESNSSAENNETSEEEIRKAISVLRASRAASPVLFNQGFGDENEQCTPPSGGTGRCTPLVNCSAVLRTIRSQNPVICRWIKDMPVVCCPAETLSRRIPDSAGCGKRPIPGLGGSRRVRRQVARIIPDFALPAPNAHNKEPTIAGGEDSVLGAWPWMVSSNHDPDDGIWRFVM